MRLSGVRFTGDLPQPREEGRHVLGVPAAREKLLVHALLHSVDNFVEKFVLYHLTSTRATEYDRCPTGVGQLKGNPSPVDV